MSGRTRNRTGAKGLASRRPRRLPVLLTVIGAVALAVPAITARPQPAAAAPAGPTASCPWLDQALPIGQRVSELVSAMSLEQKISLMQPVKTSTGPYAGYEHYVPAIPSLCVPAMVQQDDSAGVASGAAGATQLPSPMAAASTFDPGVLRQYGTVIGSEMRGKGINDALAPTLNLVRVPQWGRAFETLGEDPYLTAQLGVPDIEGIQSQGVIADVKHYAEYNQETNRTPKLRLDNEQISDRTMQETELSVFGSAVQDAHAGAIMCAFPQVNGSFTCENPYLMSTVLRGQFGFKGDVRADNAPPVSSDVTAANAGLDQAVSPVFNASALLADVQNGSISESTIDAAASAIVYPMFQMGIFNNPPPPDYSANVSTPQHVAFARSTAEQGTVLLRNSGNALPLDASQLRSVAISGADAGQWAQTSGGGSAHVLSDSVVTPLQGITARAGKGVSVTYSQGSGPYDALPDIPSASLTPASGSGQGLTTQIFDNAKLSGTPAVTGTDATVDRESSASPLPSGSATWSEEWTGALTPAATGSTQFSLTCDRPCQLLIGGQTVVDNSQVNPYQAYHTATGTADLTAGQQVPVEVTYKHNGGTAGAIAQLGWLPPGSTPPSVTQAAQAASKAQVAVVFAGTFETEAFDQPNLSLSGVGDQLIEAVARANPNTIVVLNTGGPVLMPWLGQVKGVIEGWYPGQEDGTAIASTLFGDTDPGGKLPVTFPASESQPLSADAARWPGVNGNVSYSEGLDLGYKWYDANGLAPLFPFGYGLSYTQFGFSGLTMTPANANGIDPNKAPDRVVTTAHAWVTNTGSRAGTEVAQLYLGDPSAAGEPARQLRGFQPVTLNPGQSKQVTFQLTARDLAYWDTASNGWANAPGSYQVWAGDSSATSDLPLHGTFQLP